jgi:hypothetical protein
MTNAEAATDAEVAHNSMIEGPNDEPLDGSLSLHDLWYWVLTEGHRLTNAEIAEKAVRRRGAADLASFTALTEDKKFDRGFAWAMHDADEAIRLAHTHGRIRLRGISLRKRGRVRRTPRGDLRNAVLDLLGGQPMSDKEKFGPRQYGEIGQLRPNGFVHDVTWTAVRVDKREVRKEWPYGKAQSKPRGRPRGSGKYPWSKFDREVCRRLGEEGGVDSNDPDWRQARLEKRMSEWVESQKWPEPGPSESMIRDHVVEAIRKHKQHKAE